ncbi:MAG: hypothetical protein E7620_06645 [Ruminococcaceae bacterium]|nr:hypothetical protein [Oscillospiraceae bacterium]
MVFFDGVVGGWASPLSKLGGQARFQGSTFVQLKFDYTVPENDVLSILKQFNLTNIVERFGWRAGKPAFKDRRSFS